MKRQLVLSALLALSLAPAALAAQAAPADTGWFRTNYTKREVMIPMRDGVKLFTAIYVPKDTTRAHPFVMTRTPYSVGPYGVDRYPRGLGYIPNAYAHEGMIFVYQDVRGRWMSEGDFMDVRPVVPHRTS